jgi:hypothetical protein
VQSFRYSGGRSSGFGFVSAVGHLFPPASLAVLFVVIVASVAGSSGSGSRSGSSRFREKEFFLKLVDQVLVQGHGLAQEFSQMPLNGGGRSGGSSCAGARGSSAGRLG